MQFDFAVRAGMSDCRHLFAGDYDQSGFLAAFPHSTGARRFVGFTLSAWKFGHACQRNIR
jgi:hypothetical protein